MPAILNFPDVRPDSLEWRLLTVTESFSSPETGHEQTAVMPGVARWLAAMTFTDLTRAEAWDLEAFLTELGGPAGRFYFWNVVRETPRGAASGNPVVDGAANSGGLLTSRGWTPNVNGILLRGDMVGVNGELKMLRADANSDATGKVALSIAPMLRNVPADGAAIVTASPKGIFRLIDDNQAAAKYNGATGSYSFTCVETWS